MGRKNTMTRDEEGLVWATADLLEDVRKTTGYTMAVVLRPSKLRRRFRLLVDVFPPATSPVTRRVVRYEVEYPNAHAYNLSAAIYQAVIKADKLLAAYLLGEKGAEEGAVAAPPLGR